MSREEAIRIAQGLITNFKCESETMVEFCNVVIEALEQMNVLDKIRAEINTMPCAVTSMKEIYVNRDKVINILDKYKAESEE